MSEQGPTAGERMLWNDLTELGSDLGRYSCSIEALSGTTKAVSLMLFHRLWSNYRGYIVLWKADHILEASIVLRSAVETAICLAANEKMREGFYALLLGDLSATAKKMMNIWREMGAKDLERSYAATLRNPPPGTPAKPLAFEWKSLAAIGQCEHLYENHRLLSATSAHVTGLSLMRGVVPSDGRAGHLQSEISSHEQSLGPMMACIAFIGGMKNHVRVLEVPGYLEKIADIEARLDQLSFRWAS